MNSKRKMPSVCRNHALRVMALPYFRLQRYKTGIPLVKLFTDYFYFAVTPVTLLSNLMY